MKTFFSLVLSVLFFTLQSNAQCDLANSGINVVNAANTFSVSSICIGQHAIFKFSIVNFGTDPSCEIPVSSARAVFSLPLVYAYSGPATFTSGYFNWAYNSVSRTLTGINSIAIPQFYGDSVLVPVVGVSAGTETSVLNLTQLQGVSDNPNNNTASAALSVGVAPVASISYPASSYCPSGTANVTRTGQAGGYYTSTAGLSINSTTGAINLSSSSSGTYLVKYVFTNGACTDTSSFAITIKAKSVSTRNATSCINQLPYVWNGQQYNASGTYSWTGTNAVGCDSLALLNLTVYPSTNSSFTTTACNSYVWNGTTYTQTGTYTRSYTNGNGCPSVDTLRLTVNRSTYNASTQTNCNSYAWNGTTYTQSGTYLYSYTNASGCPSVDTLRLTINRGTFTSSSQTSCNNYTWNGTTFTQSGTYTYAYTNSSGCASVDTLRLTVNPNPVVNAGTYPSVTNTSPAFTLTGSPAGGTFSGTGVSGNTFNPSVSGVGTFPVTYTFTNSTTGCTNSSTTTITVTQNVCNFTVASSITGPTNACAYIGIGDSAIYSIAATSVNTYAWTVSNTSTMGLSLNRNSSSVKIKFSTAFTSGTVAVTMTGCNGAIVTRTYSISKAVPSAPSNITGVGGTAATTYICPYIGDESITYVAAPPRTNPGAALYYRWTLPAGAVLTSVNTPDSSSISVGFPTVPTTTTITVAAVSGCAVSSVKSLSLNKATPSTPSFIAGTTDVCPAIGLDTVSSIVEYTISEVPNAASYQWEVPAGANLVYGQGSTTIGVEFNSSFLTGYITVQSISACGNSAIRSLTAVKRIASTPGAIQREFSPVLVPATTNVCNVQSATYRITKVSYATGYDWSLAFGNQVTLTHVNPPGQNDTAVIINYLSGFTRDTIRVAALTPCSVSSRRVLFVSTQLSPPAVTTISGNTTPCIGDVITYTASASIPSSSQAPVAFFAWTKPNNTTIVSANADSSSITISFNVGYTGGSITCRAKTACGVLGTAKSVSLRYTTPTPSSITSSTGSYNACIGDAVTYTVVVSAPSTTQVAAVVYRWTKPNNTTIISASADSSSIVLSFNQGYIGGSLTVKGQTACGYLGSAKTQALTHLSCPAGTKQFNSKTNLFTNEIIVLPNPTHSFWTLNLPEVSANMKLLISDAQGRLVRLIMINRQQTYFSFGEELKPGVYFAELMMGQASKKIRLIKY